ncbi:MAG: hypothetical protein IJA36_06065 [Lachnospiraceae bacterium]|nr:hypothetical protein [Lachnospiraceae bacterium]
MQEIEEYYLTTATGSVKVEISELIKLIESISAKSEKEDFVEYFKQKYIFLTAIRNKEKEAYENYKNAKAIAKAEEYAIVKEMEREYNRVRNERIRLQQEIGSRQKEHFIF